MRGLKKFAIGQENMYVCDCPEPACGDNDVKIAVKFCGLCGSDVHAYHDHTPDTGPHILGHEFCGPVVEIGKNVQRIKIGDRIVAENNFSTCPPDCPECSTGHYGICWHRNSQGNNCDGGFADFIVVSEGRAFKIPDDMSFEEGALMEPLAIATHAVLEQSTLTAGDIVLVTGPGAIGILVAQVAKAQGAKVIITGTTVDEGRLKAARELGIDITVNTDKEDVKKIIGELTNGHGVDCVFECSGAEAAVNLGFEAVKKRGEYVAIGISGKAINIMFDYVFFKELRVGGSLSHTIKAWQRAIYLCKEGKVNLKPLMTHKFKLDDWKKAIEVFDKKEGIKILIEL